MGMNIEDFKEMLDNRLLHNSYQFDSDKMFKLANDWAEKRNDINDNQIEWSWDCGFKLDFDGSICKILSRFYPPHKSDISYGLYHGSVAVYLGGKEINSKEFECDTLDNLVVEVEKYVKGLELKIFESINYIFK